MNSSHTEKRHTRGCGAPLFGHAFYLIAADEGENAAGILFKLIEPVSPADTLQTEPGNRPKRHFERTYYRTM